jgi:hypothetical protein
MTIIHNHRNERAHTDISMAVHIKFRMSYILYILEVGSVWRSYELL